VDDILRLLGQRIREIRIRRGFASQEAFADYCKMHRTFVGHLETGRKDFRLTTIIRVADALGATLSELFAGLEHGEPVRSKRIRHGTLAQTRMRQELEILERAVRNLKQLTLPENVPEEGSARASPLRSGGKRTRRPTQE
jgi:transcriptional regulator with XRE-family HTH domain